MRGILKLAVVAVLLAAGAKAFSQSTAFMVDGQVWSIPFGLAQVAPVVASSGTVYLAVWEDDSTNPYSIRCTRVNANGEILDVGGILVSNPDEQCIEPAVSVRPEALGPLRTCWMKMETTTATK